MKLKKLIVFSIFLAACFFFFGATVAKAADWYCPDAYTYYQCYYEWGGSGCESVGCKDADDIPDCDPFRNCECESATACGSYPSEECEGAEGGWNYKYNGKCFKGSPDPKGNCVGQYYYKYKECLASDRCEDANNVAGACGGQGGTGSNDNGHILAGQCAADRCSEGCANGYWYKTCCKVTGQVTAGARLNGVSGSCSNGLCTRPGETCVRATGCDSSKCLDSDYFGCWNLRDCAGPTNTPAPAATSTPAPGGGCSFSDCGAMGCASNQRYVSGDCWSTYSWFRGNGCYDDQSCVDSARINVDIVGTQHTVGDQVRIKVRQTPKNEQNCHCYYDCIDVKLGGGGVPADYWIGSACGFQSACWASSDKDNGIEREMVWDTCNMQNVPDERADEVPVGGYLPATYTAWVQYGGHGDPVCRDECCPVSTDTTSLIADPTNSCPRFYPQSGCTTGTPVTVNLSPDLNPTFDRYPACNNYSPWIPWGPGLLFPWATGGCYLSSNIPIIYEWRLNIPVTPLKEYLVTVWGRRATTSTGNPRRCNPYMKLGSGSVTSTYYQVTNNEIIGGDKTLKFSPVANTLSAYLRSDYFGQDGGCTGWGKGVAFDTLRLQVCCAAQDPTQPTCNNASDDDQVGNEVVLTWSGPSPSGWNNCAPPAENEFNLYGQVLPAGEDPVTNPATPIASCTSLSQTTIECTWSNLTLGQTYKWQVEAVNVEGGRSRSEICSFTAKEPGPWWQTTDGDVHAQGNITSTIPDCPGIDKYLSINGSGGTPGLVSWGGTTLDLGQGTASSIDFNWQANDANRRTQVGFDYLANRLNVDKTQKFEDTSLPTSNDIYYTDRTSFELQGGDVGTNKIIIFAEGEVKVMGDITVDKGGFFALIAKEKIIFDSAVTQAEGFFLTDNVIDTSIADTTFKGYGSFVAWGDFSFQRDLSNGATGGCTPSETFFARPDLYINAPKEFLIAPSFFQEMAP